MTNSSHDLRRELLNKQFLKLKNSENDLFETIILISKNMKTSYSKRVKRMLINFKNIRVETKKTTTRCIIRINILCDSYWKNKRYRFFIFLFFYFLFFCCNKNVIIFFK